MKKPILDQDRRDSLWAAAQHVARMKVIEATWQAQWQATMMDLCYHEIPIDGEEEL
jgi:hypothetical protein